MGNWLKSMALPTLMILCFILLAFGMGNLAGSSQDGAAQSVSPTRLVTTQQPPIQTDAFPKEPPIGRTPVRPVSIQVNDASPTWDWQWGRSCRIAMEGYLGKRYPMRAVEIHLVDDATLSLGVAYPELGTADAIAQTDCVGANGELFCSVSVGLGEASDALDLVMTAAILYGIDDFHRPKIRQEWEVQAAWNWSRFEPLIAETESGWGSDCLKMAR